MDDSSGGEMISRAVEGHQISIRLDKVSPNEEGELIALPSGRESIPGSPSIHQETGLSSAVHLGEHFSALLTINNEGTFELNEVKVKIELQTSTQRTVLRDDPSESACLLPGDQLQATTLHDIREIGLHIIVCSVHYTNSVTKERKFARKFFKFPVSNPLSLKTKVTEYRAEDRLYLEAQVQNVSNVDFILDSIRFEPLPPMYVRCMEPIDEENVNVLADQLAGDLSFSPAIPSPSSSMSAADLAEYRDHSLPISRMTQFAFSIGNRQSVVALDQPLPLGRLDIRWRTSGRDFGRLQTGMLVHTPATPTFPITATLLGLPSEAIKVKTSFDALLLCRNVSSSDLSDVTLIFDLPDDPAVIVPVALLGNSEVSLGNLTALNSTRLQITLYPIVGGLVEVDHFWISYVDGGGEQCRVPFKFHLKILGQC